MVAVCFVQKGVYFTFSPFTPYCYFVCYSIYHFIRLTMCCNSIVRDCTLVRMAKNEASHAHDGIVVKSNALIVAAYHLSTIENRVISYCISQIKKGEDVDGDNAFTITVPEYDKVFNEGRATGNTFGQLRRLRDTLKEKEVTLLEGGVETTFRWVQETRLDKSTSSLTLFFSNRIARYIGEMCSGQDTQYRLMMVSKFKNAYAYRLFEWLVMGGNGGGDSVISVGEFRKRLCVESKYPRMKDLTKWVIEPAMREVNAHTDKVVILKKKVKEGRAIAHFVFTYEKR